MIEYILRLPTLEDNKLIYSAWMKGAYEVSPTNFIPKPLYKQHQQNHIDRCLANYTTYMLCHPDDPNYLFGFICFSYVGSVLVVHWLYIKKMHRLQGLMADLLKELNTSGGTVVLTQYNKYYYKLKDKFSLSYDPYYILEH